MKLEAYLQKHALTKRVLKPDFIPDSWQGSDGDKIEVYANDDGTHVIIKNLTTRQFKIRHAELLCFESNWAHSQSDHRSSDSLVFW